MVKLFRFFVAQDFGELHVDTLNEFLKFPQAVYSPSTRFSEDNDVMQIRSQGLPDVRRFKMAACASIVVTVLRLSILTPRD